MRRMTKWSPKATDFTVAVTTNAQVGTRYSNIPNRFLPNWTTPTASRSPYGGTRSC